MRNVGIYLRGKSVYFRVNIAGKRIWISSKISVFNIKSWDAKNKRITALQPNFKALNENISLQRANLERIILGFLSDRRPLNVDAFTQALSRPEGAKKGNIISFLDYFPYYQEKKKPFLRQSYLRKFNTVHDHLQKFNPSIGWNDIDDDFYDAYLGHLIEHGLQNNSISSHIKKIVTICTDAVKAGYVIPESYQNFKDTYIKPRPLFLYWSEVELLEKCKPTLKSDEVYRDEFLLRCYNGMRWGDNQQTEVNPKGVIDMTSLKTKKNQSLAVNSKAEAILNKYGGKLPKLSQSDCNERIKVVAKKAKLNRMVEKIRFKGNDRIVKLLPLHQLVTTHTARRTFGRKWVDDKGNELMLMKFYGHSTLEQTLEYIGYESEEMNKEMLRIFNK